MEDDTDSVHCFACLDPSADDQVQCIFANDGEIADFLKQVGIKVSVLVLSVNLCNS